MTSNAGNQCCLSHEYFHSLRSKTAVLRAARSHCPTVRTPSRKVACPKWRNHSEGAIRTTSITRRKPIEPDIDLDRASAKTHLGLPTQGSGEASPFLLPLSLRLAIRIMILYRRLTRLSNSAWQHRPQILELETMVVAAAPATETATTQATARATSTSPGETPPPSANSSLFTPTHTPMMTQVRSTLLVGPCGTQASILRG